MTDINIQAKLLEKLDELGKEQEKAQSEWQNAQDERRKELEARLTKIDEAVTDIKSRIEKAERLSLPGLDPAKDENDTKGFSWGRMAKACLNPKVLREKEYGIEKEVYDQMQKAYSSLDAVVKAELNASTGEEGAFLIPTEMMQQMIPILRETAIIRGLGATVIPGLVGNVIWNRMASDVSAYHVNTEASEGITESAPTIQRIEMRPHVLAALVPMTYEMRTQSAISLDAFVRESIAAQFGLAQDQVAFLGTGAASQPRGLKNHPDVQSFDWDAAIGGDTLQYGDGTNVQTVTKRLLAIWKLVRKASAARGRLGWAMSPDALAKISTTIDRDGVPIFGTPGDLLPSSLLRSTYPIRESELLDDAADTDETLVFGNFSEAVIGEWGTMAFAMSENTSDDFAKLRSRLRGVMAWDFAIWHGSSFVNVVDLAA